MRGRHRAGRASTEGNGENYQPIPARFARAALDRSKTGKVLGASEDQPGIKKSPGSPGLINAAQTICKPTCSEKTVSAQRQFDGLGQQLPPGASKEQIEPNKKGPKALRCLGPKDWSGRLSRASAASVAAGPR